MTEAQRQHRWTVILNFGLVYLFWGSTYLGIRIGVEHIPPALMCGARFITAGTLLLFYCGVSGRTIRYNPRELGQMAIIGILLLMGGNLTLSYAELIVPSGLAALLVSVTPLWFLVLDSLLLGHHRISKRGVIGLVLGIAGMVVLLWPDLRATGALGRRELWSALTLPLGSFSWALGSVLSKRWESGADRLSSTAWQMTFAGVGNLLLAVVIGDFSRVVWTVRGMGAVLYLIVCGSWIGYTAYIWLLGHVPTSKVSTYAYVNPVVAVFLGWAIEHEVVNQFIFTGSAIVIASVILVTSAKVRERAAEEELVETVGD
ncbi:MAG: EamA family transporter [Acidobacteria bacterium]|nr:MAG: EamA family transporter [Acidobacteriota bacterium]PYY06793.1 MAG: EamA family transporter [Acidobacteriota bacterium]